MSENEKAGPDPRTVELPGGYYLFQHRPSDMTSSLHMPDGLHIGNLRAEYSGDFAAALSRPDGEAIAGTGGVREALAEKCIRLADALEDQYGGISVEDPKFGNFTTGSLLREVSASLANDAPPIAAAAQGEAVAYPTLSQARVLASVRYEPETGGEIASRAKRSTFSACAKLRELAIRGMVIAEGSDDDPGGKTYRLPPATPPAPARAPEPAAVESYQDRVKAACAVLFEGDPTDVAERRDRFAEEALETCQAFGMTRDDMRALVDYTFGRPLGEPAKEIGAAMTTLASLCVYAGGDLMACAEADLAKLQQPETIARIRAKRATRHGRGSLPGLSSPAPEDRQVVAGEGN